MKMPLVFAIGDIHGCLDELDDLINLCEKYARVSDRQAHFVFIGDYIDRGPDSKGVIDRLMRLDEKHPCSFLMGNHERWCLHNVFGTDAWGGWTDWGGTETMNSFGVKKPSDIPEKYVAWMGKLLPWVADAAHYYVHAGFYPEVPVEANTEDHRLWIRKEFLHSTYDWGKLVLHGHTPCKVANSMLGLMQKNLDFRKVYNRVNLDTGCVYGGELTAAVLEQDIRDPIDYLHISASKVYWASDGRHLK